MIRHYVVSIQMAVPGYPAVQNHEVDTQSAEAAIASAKERYPDYDNERHRFLVLPLRIGSQYREHIEIAGYTVVGSRDGALLLADDSGRVEVWAPSDDFAGYVIEVEGIGYEFVSSL